MDVNGWPGWPLALTSAALERTASLHAAYAEGVFGRHRIASKPVSMDGVPPPSSNPTGSSVDDLRRPQVARRR
jgi:hypothetical protein